MSDRAFLSPLSCPLQSPIKNSYLHEFSPGARKLGLLRYFVKPTICQNEAFLKYGYISKSLNSDASGQNRIVGGVFEQHNEAYWNGGFSSRSIGKEFPGKRDSRGVDSLLDWGRWDGLEGNIERNRSGRYLYELNCRSVRNDILGKFGRSASPHPSMFSNSVLCNKRHIIQSCRSYSNDDRGERDGTKLTCAKKKWNPDGLEVFEGYKVKQSIRGEDEDASLNSASATDTEQTILGSNLSYDELDSGHLGMENNATTDSSISSSFDLLGLKKDLQKPENVFVAGSQGDSDLVPAGGAQKGDKESEEEELVQWPGTRRKQVLRRSNLLAKQVISMQSALSLGFVSQLWVDISAWTVALIEVRPSLLSGEMDRFLLEDVFQVGDVVLVQDESAMENEFKMIGLDTLVGHNVVTPSRRNVGKVRGYAFNINSGEIQLLELDSFGISIIPASLVSTYGLPVEDVLEVTSDTVVVHDAAALHIQRLSKGLWDARTMDFHGEELREYSGLGSLPSRGSRRRRSYYSNIDGKRASRKMKDSGMDWEMPMDY